MSLIDSYENEKVSHNLAGNTCNRYDFHSAILKTPTSQQ